MCVYILGQDERDRPQTAWFLLRAVFVLTVVLRGKIGSKGTFCQDKADFGRKAVYVDDKKGGWAS